VHVHLVILADDGRQGAFRAEQERFGQQAQDVHRMRQIEARLSVHSRRQRSIGIIHLERERGRIISREAVPLPELISVPTS
jgi:hypothetical protein